MSSKSVSKPRKMRFRKWKVVYRRRDKHPRVMIARRRIHGKRKVINAKLHHYTGAKDPNLKKVILFDHNPNPKDSKNKGAYYRRLENDSISSFQDNRALRDWKISHDGKRKMRDTLREKDKNRKLLEKKEKQTYQSVAPIHGLIHLFNHIKTRQKRKSN